MTDIGTWASVIGGLIALALGPSSVSSGEIQKILDNSKAFAAQEKTGSKR